MARHRSYQVTLLPPALRDMDEIHAYIATSNPLNADRFLLGLRECVHSLERFPKRCRVARESRSAGFEVRAATFGAYRVFFTIVSSHVAVMRVVHTARKKPLADTEA